MTGGADLAKAVRAALERAPEVNLHEAEVRVQAAGDLVTLEGEVPDISAKRRAVRVARAVAGVGDVLDRLRVRPATRMTDPELADHLRDALLAEPALAGVNLTVSDPRDHAPQVVRAVDRGAAGEIIARVDQGVVTLAGVVRSLSHRRLAGALAWWLPGTRDVINLLLVDPPEEDNDGEIVDALRLILETDRLVDASAIHVESRDRVVRLTGSVPSAEQARLAEYDAWYTDGVRDVINELVAP